MIDSRHVCKKRLAQIAKNVSRIQRGEVRLRARVVQNERWTWGDERWTWGDYLALMLVGLMLAIASVCMMGIQQ